LELGISKDRADELLDSVRQIVMKTFQADVLTGVAKIKADQFHEAILTNNIVSIKQLLPAIETLVSNNRNEEIHFRYYMSLAAIDPKRCIETYENSRTDDYWLTYWTCLSYAKQNMPETADRLLMELEIKFHHIPSDNTVILAAACASVSQNIESAKSYLNSVQHNYSSLLQDLYTVLYQYIKPSKKATVSKFYDECLLLPNNEEDRDRKSAANDRRILYNSDCSILIGTKAAFKEKSFKVPLCVKQIGKVLNYDPKKTTNLKELGFYECTSLQNVEFHDNIKVIGAYAFGKTSIEKLILPDSVEEIHAGAFLKMRNLQEVRIPPECKVDTYGLCSCSAIKECNLPEGITCIGESAFWRTFNLKRINIPKSVYHIQKTAFYESSIEEITIHKGIKVIDDFAFANASKLENVYIHCAPKLGINPFKDTLFNLHIIDMSPSLELDEFVRNLLKANCLKRIYVKKSALKTFENHFLEQSFPEFRRMYCLLAPEPNS
jgi:hypothetical protein